MAQLADGGWSAGLVAAAGVAVAKQLPMRDPLPAGLPPRFSPTSLRELRTVFDTSDGSAAARVARLSSASLVYSVDKANATHSRALLRASERDVLERLHREQLQYKHTSRACAHCDLMLGTVYGEVTPPVVIVRHSAHIKVAFDPDTNIAEGSIENFQVIVPGAIATDLLRLAHPLHWGDAPGSLIKRTTPVGKDGRPVTFTAHDPSGREAEWENRAKNGHAFIFEAVDLPINASVRATAENIIRISRFARTTSNDGHSLSFDYSLERCVRSNFGIAWEPSGLDIDDGTFRATAIPLRASARYAADLRPVLSGLTRRDVTSWVASTAPDEKVRAQARKALCEGWDSPPASALGTRRSSRDVDPVPALDRVSKQDVADTFATVTAALEQRHEGFEPFWLVDVTASKRLHFTVPENGPIELWQLLTQSAPSFLFAFLNQAVCLAPHVLIAERNRHSSQGVTAS